MWCRMDPAERDPLASTCVVFASPIVQRQPYTTANQLSSGTFTPRTASK